MSPIDPTTNEGFIRDAGEIGGYFECQRRISAKGKVCGFRIHIPEDEAKARDMIAEYVHGGGYPQHCGVTMTWVSGYEARHGKKAMRQQLFDPARGPDGGQVEGRDASVPGAEEQKD